MSAFLPERDRNAAAPLPLQRAGDLAGDWAARRFRRRPWAGRIALFLVSGAVALAYAVAAGWLVGAYGPNDRIAAVIGAERTEPASAPPEAPKPEPARLGLAQNSVAPPVPEAETAARPESLEAPALWIAEGRASGADPAVPATARNDASLQSAQSETSPLPRHLRAADIFNGDARRAEPAVSRLTAQALEARLAGAAFNLDRIRSGDAHVPPIFVQRLPGDMDKIDAPGQRKILFIKTVLPLILKVNANIERNRERLEALRPRVENRESLDPVEEVWLLRLARDYDLRAEAVGAVDYDELQLRVDTIPPSLGIAQAAIETGWGTSRFARQGNALFGQRTWDPLSGIEPKHRPADERHLVKTFPDLLASVKAYVFNLNTHPTYAAFRAARQEAREEGLVPKGKSLAFYLLKYSDRGKAYIRDLRDTIRANGLLIFDAARLAKRPPIQVASRRDCRSRCPR